MRIVLASATFSTFITFSRRFLGVGYLHAYALADPDIAAKAEITHECYDTRTVEPAAIAREILAQDPDLVGFACYVWNTPSVLAIVARMKELKPGLRVVLGGPEVSYHYVRILEKNPTVDFIVVGEGERTFAELLRHHLLGAPELAAVDGLAYRGTGGQVLVTKPRAYEKDLDVFPSPYLSGVLAVDELVGAAYFQTTRGCPFMCTYCDFGRNQPYFEFSMARVEAEFRLFTESGARALFCADATFNYKRARAYEILRQAIDLEMEAMLWIEVFPSLIDDELIDLLSRMKRVFCGVGIQTTHKETMRNIHRVWKPEQIAPKLDRIAALPNCYLGLELIMGLPGDNLETYKRGLDWSYARRPHNIFSLNLQILSRTPMEREVDKYDIRYMDGEGGHEIVSNYSFGKEEILVGKAITDWHTQLQPVFYRLAAVSGRRPSDLVEQWSYQAYYAGLYEDIAEYRAHGIRDEAFGPLGETFRAFCDEALGPVIAPVAAGPLTDFFRYMCIRWAKTEIRVFITDILDVNGVVTPAKDHRIASVLAADLPPAARAEATLVPELLSGIRYETFCCDMRDLWDRYTLEEMRGLEIRDTNHAILTEPRTGAGRAVLVDDLGRGVLDRIDGSRSLAAIAAELGAGSGEDREARVRKVYDQLERAGFVRDSRLPPDPHQYQVGVFSDCEATGF